jgi:hypothetical protein
MSRHSATVAIARDMASARGTVKVSGSALPPGLLSYRWPTPACYGTLSHLSFLQDARADRRWHRSSEDFCRGQSLSQVCFAPRPTFLSVANLPACLSSISGRALRDASRPSASCAYNRATKLT